jgi:chorismate mutase
MEKDFKEQLRSYRHEIDRIDQKLVDLLNERAQNLKSWLPIF